MKICLDLRYKTESGASAYIHHLVPELLAADPSVRYVFVKYAGQSFPFESAAEAVITCPRMPVLFQILWTNLLLPFKLRRRGIDLYHALKMAGYYWHPERTVMTMHSIMTKFEGEFPATFSRRLFVFFYAHWLINRAGRIIAVSNFTKKCLLSQYRVPADRIDVIPHGASGGFSRSGVPPERVLDRLDVRRPYLLCVGNVFPVKNHVTAVRALAKLRDWKNLELVIAGNTNHPCAERVKAEAAALGVKDRVRFTGFLPEGDLAALMNGAELMLLPSLTEGFCVTLIEAFRCGVPVIASRRGALPELGEGCAAFVDDPMDAGGFAAAADRLLRSEGLRRELSEKAVRRAGQFTWKATAEAHLSAYRALRSKLSAASAARSDADLTRLVSSTEN